MPRRVPYSEDTLKQFNEWYDRGYEDGFSDASGKKRPRGNPHGGNEYFEGWPKRDRQTVGPRKKRKLSAWNKFVKANSKKPRFIYRNGKLNLKKMAVAFRKTPAGKKKRKR